jgi:hypothetical protein
LRPSFLIPLVVFPGFRPLDDVIPDPIMGATLEIPIPNRRVKADGLAVINQPPAIGREIGNYLVSAPAATIVRCDSERKRDVDNAILKLWRHMFDESMLKFRH